MAYLESRETSGRLTFLEEREVWTCKIKDAGWEVEGSSEGSYLSPACGGPEVVHRAQQGPVPGAVWSCL